MEIKEIIKLYNLTFGESPASVRRLPGAGSSRHYYRVYSPKNQSENLMREPIPATVIACVGENLSDNRAFIGLSEAFANEAPGVCIPHIYGVSDRGDVYLQTDFGDTSLMDLIVARSKGEFPEADLRDLLRASLSALVKMQCVDMKEIENCLEYRPFSARQVMWDLNYFKYEFLKPSAVCFDEWMLEDDFESLCRDLLSCPESIWGFMYRDFQSRNIIVVDKAASSATGSAETPSVGKFTSAGIPGVSYLQPGFIDYQGGMRGPGIYDAVSFLWQAKAGFSDSLRAEMLDYYASEYSSARGDCNVTKEDVLGCAGLYAFFRTLQVLGAYGFRGLVQKKSHFIESIPGAVDNLRRLIDKGVADPYPELKKSCEALLDDDRWSRKPDDGLTVSVFSFSYKNGGYPADYSGNGGGFMFDCRALHNPGRYEEYKSLTGEDTPVVAFLEERGEVQAFLEHAYALVDKAVATYLRRGFRNLQIGFGCTGGQHRSVYCARHAAEHIAAAFPEARVVLMHRQQMPHPIEISADKNGVVTKD